MSINSEMTALADAIREKSGASGKLTISGMTAAVNGIVINAGSDIDFTGVNVTPDEMLSGAVAINANGQKITGNIDTVKPTLTDNVVTVPQGYISSNQTLTVPEAAAPITSGNVVTVNKGYQSEQKKLTVGTEKAADTITPGTADQSIAAGTYLSGKQTIKGEANLLPENIKKDVSIFGVVGTHEVESGTSAGVAVGTIFAYPASVPPEGAYLLNGQTIANCSTIYPKFWEWVQSAGVRIIDSATYEAELASTGVCGGFAVDTEAGSIRLPSVMQGTLWGADSGSTGQSLAAGLPNITGSFTPRDSAAYPAGAGTGGAFKVGTKTSSAILGSQSGYDGYAMTFDASRSNAIYGNSDTVQPPAVRVSWCIQVFTSATDFSEQESTQLASEMQLKAQTDLANVNSAGKSFIVDQLTYGVPETREINVVYQAEKAGYAYVSAKASSNANTTDKIASMVVQASPYADFSQNNIYARRNDLNANASATHIQFIPEGWYYRFVTYNSTDETLRFFPVNSDN